MSLASKIADAIQLHDSLLCLGLDPATAKSADDAEAQCERLLDEVLPYVSSVKPNVAFFSRFGSAGWAVLERLRERIPTDRILIFDAKVGDIGHTSEAYAQTYFGHLKADAVTVNPLMGKDSVAPFLDTPDKGAFILTRTSNPGAADFLEQRLHENDRLYERIADTALSWDQNGAVGLVVGATDPTALKAVRNRAPDVPLLLPGVGAQGADLEKAVLSSVDQRGGGILIPVSRAIAQATSPEEAARNLRDEINQLRQGHRSAVIS